MAHTGVLVINLGSPEAPTTPAVRRYLREFLSDPRVLDIHPVGRWLLLNLVILPKRPAQSAEAYAKIWTDEGSPLLVHGRALVEGLREQLPEYPVELAMRYGEPSIPAGLEKLRAAGCERIIIFPLYPQYASSSTGTALEVVYQHAAKLWNTPALSVVPPFYDEPGFVQAFTEVARPVLSEVRPEHVLLSFHGLPERQIEKSDDTGTWCLKRPDCCDTIGPGNRFCYRAQCYATGRALAESLELAPDGYTICFQSRLGRSPWIRPYTDVLLDELAEKGVRRIAVLCPAFVADCLETLEEIALRNAEDFRRVGGDTLRLVPSLNAHPAWVDAAAALIRRAG